MYFVLLLQLLFLIKRTQYVSYISNPFLIQAAYSILIKIAIDILVFKFLLNLKYQNNYYSFMSASRHLFRYIILLYFVYL